MDNDLQPFADRVAWVTGGGSGIGAAAAELFAARGGSVVVADVNLRAAEQVAEGIRNRGQTAIAHGVDVSDEEQVAGLLKRTLDAFGRLDHAFNNAGIPTPDRRPIGEMSLADWDRTIGVNLTGIFLCTRAALEPMVAAGRGSIVNTASVMSVVAAPNITPYTSSKHGVAGFTKGVAVEYAARGIRINAVLPGPIATPMLAAADASGKLNALPQKDLTPMGREGSPLELALAALWLLSDEASFVTGACLPVDGGMTLT